MMTGTDPSTGPTRSPISTSQRREMLLFLARSFCLTRWYHKQRLGTHWLSAVLSFLVQLTQQNGCMGAYRVIDLEQFPVRISTDKAPTQLTKFGICSFFFFFFFFFCDRRRKRRKRRKNKSQFFFRFFSLFFFLFFFFFFFFFLPFSVSPRQIHGVSVRFSWDDPCLHNNNKEY